MELFWENSHRVKASHNTAHFDLVSPPEKIFSWQFPPDNFIFAFT